MLICSISPTASTYVNFIACYFQSEVYGQIFWLTVPPFQVFPARKTIVLLLLAVYNSFDKEGESVTECLLPASLFYCFLLVVLCPHVVVFSTTHAAVARLWNPMFFFMSVGRVSVIKCFSWSFELVPFGDGSDLTSGAQNGSTEICRGLKAKFFRSQAYFVHGLIF